MNVLVVCHEYPRPDVAASNCRLFEILKMMTAAGHRVDLFCPHESQSMEQPRYAEAYRSAGVRVTFGNRYTGIKRCVLRRRYALVLFEWWVAVPSHVGAVRRYQPWATVAVDAVDVCFVREEAAVKVGRLDAAVVAEGRRREVATYRAADAVIAVTPDDRAALMSEGVVAPIFLVPVVNPAAARPARVRRREVLFVGNFGMNKANVDGVLWFAGTIWPRVRAGVPDARLTLVGSDPPPEIAALSALPGVQVTGFVPDLGPYLERAAVSVAPLRYGGGMKGKVTEAMAHGLPVVATEFGSQGLGATAGVHLIVADAPDAFADELCAVLRDPDRAEVVGRAGQRFIAGLCSPDVVAGRVGEFLEWAEVHRRPAGRAAFRWSAQSAFDRVSHAVLPRKSIQALVAKFRRATP